MKPKAPKKDKKLPRAKTGKVKRDNPKCTISIDLDWKGELPTYYVIFDKKHIEDIKFKFDFKD